MKICPSLLVSVLPVSFGPSRSPWILCNLLSVLVSHEFHLRLVSRASSSLSGRRTAVVSSWPPGLSAWWLQPVQVRVSENSDFISMAHLPLGHISP